MYLYQLGWNWKHSADLKIERPNGHFGMQLIVVRTRGRLRMGGAEYRVKPNTAFLVQSCLPHCIYADGEPYADDWIRFSPEQDDHDFLDNLKVRWNEPIQLPECPAPSDSEARKRRQRPSARAICPTSTASCII